MSDSEESNYNNYNKDCGLDISLIKVRKFGCITIPLGYILENN